MGEIDHCRTGKSQLLDPDIGEIDGLTVVLEADGAFLRNIRQLGVFDDHAAVEGDGEAVALDGDHGPVPLALRAICAEFRVTPARTSADCFGSVR